MCGVEPNPINISELRATPEELPLDYKLSVGEGIVSNKGEKICTLKEKNNQFILIEGAIDCGEEREQNFYCTNEINRGCSSLYEPVNIPYGIETENIIKVNTFSLDSLVEKLNWQNEMCIDYLKIDTQGNDLNVIKSCQKYIHLFAFIQLEFFTRGEYANIDEEKTELAQFNKTKLLMEERNFACVMRDHSDALFVNMGLIEFISYTKIDESNHSYQSSNWFEKWCLRNPELYKRLTNGQEVPFG